MNKHQKFLEFNNKPIFFLDIEGIYWIALKPICEALNLAADRVIKTTKNDPFLGGCTSFQTVQVGKNGKNQGRKMTCLPEKYIYGWICFLRSDSEELSSYKETCYNLIYNHFHGTVGNRKELLIERNDVDTEITDLKERMKEVDEMYNKLNELQNDRKVLSYKLNSLDNNIINQTELFNG